MLNQIPLLALTLGLLRCHVVAQQATCLDGYTWMYNSLQQNPCDIASKLAGVCNGGIWSISPLPLNNFYIPYDAEFMNKCVCNSVFYSVLAACSACQGRIFIKFSAWTPNCTAIYSQQYPDHIPDGTAVPHYAYLDVVTSDTFDLGRARAAGGPESTRPARPIYSPTLTTSSINTTTIPTTTSNPYPTSSPSIAKKTDVGAIAGAVSGGIVGLAALGVLVFFLLRRRPSSESPVPTTSNYDPMMAKQTLAGVGDSSHPPSPTAPGSSSVAVGLPQQYPAMYANQVPANFTDNLTTSFMVGLPQQYNGTPEV